MDKRTIDFSNFDFSKVKEKLQEAKSLHDLTGPGGMMQIILKEALEQILKGEQKDHLGYSPYQKEDSAQSNSRNGYSSKTLKTSVGPVEIAIPRDRQGSYAPQIIKKYEGIDRDLERKITGMYARGMSVRDIKSQLEEAYGTEVSPAFISRVTDHLLEGIKQWQERPLEDIYPIVFLDAIHYKVRHEGKVICKAAYTCLGYTLEGKMDVLGTWIAQTEGAHFWLSILTEIKARGVKDIFICCVDGLKGFPEAIASAFPHTLVQLCIVHQIRTSVRFIPWKSSREFCNDLKLIYRADSLEHAERELKALEEKWGARYPSAVGSWKNNWHHLSTFFAFPQEIRRMIYTTNAVESLHRQFRKVTKAKGSFPTDEALKKMLYLATFSIKGLKHGKQGWPQILGQLKIIFEDRMPEGI